MDFTEQQVADTIGISRSTVGKAIRRNIVDHGCMPPGVSADRRTYTDEFIDWFASRPYARPELQGLKRDGSYMPGTSTKARPVVERRTDPLADEPLTKANVGKAPQSAHVAAVVTGLTAAQRIPDEAALWARAEDIERRGFAKAELRYDQTVAIPDEKPVLMVVAGDIHLGNSYCSYSRARRDAELVRDTPGAYLMVLGDLVDHWVSLDPQMVGIQRESPMPHSDEMALLGSWVGMVKEKLLAVVAGNHDLRSYRIAGVDILQHALGNATVLYDHAEVRFSLALGGASWNWKLRHKWPGRSQNNEAFGFLKDSRFCDGSWDIGVGGHWHPDTMVTPFTDKANGNRRKWAVQLGSYQYDSAYARDLGMAQSNVGGSAALLLWPSGKVQPFEDLEIATRFLAMERAR